MWLEFRGKVEYFWALETAVTVCLSLVNQDKVDNNKSIERLPEIFPTGWRKEWKEGTYERHSKVPTVFE